MCYTSTIIVTFKISLWPYTHAHILPKRASSIYTDISHMLACNVTLPFPHQEVGSVSPALNLGESCTCCEHSRGEAVPLWDVALNWLGIFCFLLLGSQLSCKKKTTPRKPLWEMQGSRRGTGGWDTTWRQTEAKEQQGTVVLVSQVSHCVLGWFVAKQLITRTLFRDSHFTDNKMEV